MSNTTTPSLDWMISVDDHVVEPPDVWRDRVPAKYRDAAPHVVVDRDGEVWVYEGIKGKTGSAMNATVHRSKRAEISTPDGITYADMAPGCYDPWPARIHDMNLAGILASMSFPVLPPVLRPDLPRGQGQGTRPALRAGVERLDDRRVVRLCAGPLHPAHAHPAVGPPGGGGRDRADAPVRAPRDRLLGEPDRSACRPSTTSAATGIRCRGRRTRRVVICMHVGSSSKLPAVFTTLRRSPTWRSGRPHGRHHAVVVVRRRLRAVP